MITMFNDSNEYVSRIKRGVNLQLEFAPEESSSGINIAKEQARAVKISEQLASLQSSQVVFEFARGLERKSSNTSRLSRLDISEEDLAEFKDCYTGEIANVPVRLAGDLFDIHTLTQQPDDSEGMKKNPLNGTFFTIANIQPAKDIQRRIDALEAKYNSDAAPSTSSPRF